MQVNEKRLPVVKRQWSRGEEIANSLSHGIGFALALIGAPFLICAALRHGGFWNVAGASVFVVATLLLYFCSAMLHALPQGPAKDRFEVLDHAAIYILIAGTYTPFTLGVLRGGWGWTLFGVIWALAIAGVVFKTMRGVGNVALSNSIYILMGWLIVIAARPMWMLVPMPGLLLLVFGGLAYTAGLAFFLARRMPYHHLLWHCSVLAGTACHYFAVLGYAWRPAP
jgi:hemolysin III